MTWTTAKYPGDAVRITMIRRGNEIGDVRIQHYDVAGRVRVGSFLPGCVVESPGDTPKTEPEKHEWCRTRAHADLVFDQYVGQAQAEGWTEYVP